jgi:hypothetical protein
MNKWHHGFTVNVRFLVSRRNFHQWHGVGDFPLFCVRGRFEKKLQPWKEKPRGMLGEDK